MGGECSSPTPEGNREWNLRHGAAEHIGGRRTMEDTHAAMGGPKDSRLTNLGGECRGFYVVSLEQSKGTANFFTIDG